MRECEVFDMIFLAFKAKSKALMQRENAEEDTGYSLQMGMFLFMGERIYVRFRQGYINH